MIASRITKNEKTLNEYGVALKDEQGNLRETFEVLGDLSVVWDKLSDSERVSLGQTLAGVNQYKIFAAIMSNFQTAVDACDTSMNSFGATARQNSVYMESVEAKTALLKSAFQDLVLGEGGLERLIKGFLDAGTSVIKFVDSDLGKLTVGLLALVPIITKLITTFGGFTALMGSNVIVSAIASLIAGETTLGQVTSVLTTKFIENALAWAATPMGMATLLIGSIAALAFTAEKFNKTLEKQTEELNNVASAYEQAKSEVQSIQDELKKVRDKIEEINSQGGAQVADKEQLQELEKQEQALIRQLAIKKQIAEEARKAAEEAAKEALTSQVTVTTNTGLTDTTMLADPSWALEKSTKAYAENQEQIESLTETLNTYLDANGNVIEGNEEAVNEIETSIEWLEAQNDAIEELATGIVESFDKIVESLPEGKLKEGILGLIDGWLEASGVMQEAEAEVSNVDDALEEEEEVVDEAAARLEALAEAHGIAVEDLNKLAKAVGISAEALLDYADAQGVSVEQAAKYLQSVESWNNSIDSLQDAYGKLTSAVEEYNEVGYLSLDTVQSLLELSPEYLSMLTEENGKLVLNEEAIINKAQALIEERKQTALQMAMEKLAAIERGENASAADAESGSIDGNASSLDAETQALSLNTVEQYKNKIARDSKGSKYSAAKQVVDDLKKELAIIDTIGNSYGKVSTSAIKSGNQRAKAAGSASKALDEENKKLQELKKQYDTVISWINKQYDRKIKELQNAKKAAQDAVQDEIDGLKSAKEEEIKGIEASIKALKAEKEAAIDAITTKIKLLEKEKKTVIDGLKAQKKELQDARDAETKSIKSKIDALKKEKEAAQDAVDEEIDDLKKLKSEREKYWDEQINALKKVNDQRKDALELQEKLDALERAKNTKVKVYKKGEGFVYDTDQTKVAEAQKDLDEYLSQKAYEDELERLENLKQAESDNYQARIDKLTSFKEAQNANYQEQIDALNQFLEDVQANYDDQIAALETLIDAKETEYENEIEILEAQKEATTNYYEDQLDALETYKDNVQDSYDAQIDALEAHKDALGKQYDAEIEMYQNYKDQFQDMCNAYEDAQAKLLFEQLTGLSAENDNWMTRLSNLSKFVNEYNRLQAQLNSGKTDNTSNYSGSTVVDSGTPKTKTTTPHDTIAGSAYVTTPVSTPTDREYQARVAHKAVSYATGVKSVKEDEVAIVGENPYQELVVGSKLNGELMNLEKGSRVVSARDTKSMAGLLNQIGAFGGSSFGAGNGTLNNNTTSNDNSFNINGVTINGAGITDPQSFATALLNFKAQAIQRAYKR